MANIKLYGKNAKRHPDAQLKQIAKSLKEFGCRQPIVVDKNNEIIVGHGRWLAYNKYKDEYNLKQPAIERADDLTPQQVKAYRLVDNKLNESDWDMDLAIEELKELDDSLFELTGFDKDLLIEQDDKDDEVPEVPDEPKSKMGDIFELPTGNGNFHRIMAGDSVKREDVEKLMDGVKADCVFTDPPYGMKKEKEGVLNDNQNLKDLLEFNKNWIELSFDFLTDVGSWYCWGIDEPLMDIYSNILKPLMAEQKLTFRNLITWDKGNGQGQLAKDFRMYPIADEKCLFVMKGVQGFNTNSDNYFEQWEPIRLYLLKSRKEMGWDVPTMKKIVGHSDLSRDHWTSKSQWTMITEDVYLKLQKAVKKREAKEKKEYSAFKKEYSEIKKEYSEIKKEYSEIKKEYYSTRAYFNNTHDNMNNVWKFGRDTERVGKHATPKPVELCERAIKSSSKKNDIVLDLFLGSGSTMIACEKTNRICFGMELDLKYVDVIIQRYENFTGNKVKLI